MQELTDDMCKELDTLLLEKKEKELLVGVSGSAAVCGHEVCFQVEISAMIRRGWWILARLPRHIAIIMDGNGRWAKQQGQCPARYGHAQWERKYVVRICEDACKNRASEYLTVYAFSTENW